MSVAPLKAGTNILSAGPETLIERCGEAVAAADRVLQAAKAGVRIKIQEAGGIDNAQHAAHGLAWLATAVEGLRQMHDWASRIHGEGRFGEFEQLLLIAAFAEYTAQIAGGIPMSQIEIIRADALGVAKADLRRFEDSVTDLIAEGGSEAVKGEARRAYRLAARRDDVRRYRPRRDARADPGPDAPLLSR